jgi:hypothetical protein
MLREYVSLNDPSYMSSADCEILDAIMFYRTWPDIIANKTIAGDFNYSNDVKKFLCDVSNLSWETVNTIIQGLCRQEYYKPLDRLVSLIFDQVDADCCSEFLEPAFIEKVEERIVFNECTTRTKKIAKMAYDLVARMINGNGSLNHLRLLSMSQAKAVIVYILVTNITLYASVMDGKLGLAA